MDEIRDFAREQENLLEQLRTAPGPFDLHTHTNVSDGHETPAGLCLMAAQAGISHLCISDHEYPLPTVKARALSLRYGLDVIPGVELTAAHKVEGSTVLLHLGIPWVPGDDEELNRLMAHNQSLSDDIYLRAMLQKLYDLGIDPSGEGVEKSLQMIWDRNPRCRYFGKGVVGDLLVETGCCLSRQGANDLFLSRHGRRLAYVDKAELFDYVTAEQVLRAISRLNRERDTAVPVILNHPFHYGLEQEVLAALIGELARMGLHGMEVVYPKHGPERERRLRDMCAEHGLLECGGSDYHYDAHNLLRGDPDTFETLLKFHRKELSAGAGRWW